MFTLFTVQKLNKKIAQKTVLTKNKGVLIAKSTSASQSLTDITRKTYQRDEQKRKIGDIYPGKIRAMTYLNDFKGQNYEFGSNF